MRVGQRVVCTYDNSYGTVTRVVGRGNRYYVGWDEPTPYEKDHPVKIPGLHLQWAEQTADVTDNHT